MSFTISQKLIKPVLIVIAGPNGSGKTEATKIIRAKYTWTEGLVEINPDTIAQEEFGDWNNIDAVKKAAQRADEIREYCLLNRKGLLFETALSIPQKIDYIQRAKNAGYFIRLVYVATENVEINLLRVSWRAYQGGHSVPIDKIRSRYERSLKLAVEAARIADRAYFVDNSKSVEISVGQILPLALFRTISGVIEKTYFSKNLFPEWAKKIYDELS